MIIIRNIPGVYKFYSCLKYLTRYRDEIDRARRSGDDEKEREYILKATSLWGKKMSQRLNMDIKVYGRENLPSEGPVVYMSNHQGYADIVALCSVLDTVQFGYIAKESLSRIPLYGRWADRIRSVMINRGNPREGLKAISTGAKYVKQGFSMCIFPEGTRSRKHEMNEFKPGAMKLATKAGAPIIPITLDGTWHVFEEKGMVRPAEVRILIHPPVETAGLSKEEEHRLNDVIYSTINDGLNTLDTIRQEENSMK